MLQAGARPPPPKLSDLVMSYVCPGLGRLVTALSIDRPPLLQSNLHPQAWERVEAILTEVQPAAQLSRLHDLPGIIYTCNSN